MKNDCVPAASRRWFAAGTLALLWALGGCSTPSERGGQGAAATERPQQRVRQLPRNDPGIVEIAPGWIRHPVHGVLPVESGTGEVYIVRTVGPASDAIAGQPSRIPVPDSEAPPLRARGELIEVDNGLPRTGQWRDGFALAPLGTDRFELMTPPARKTGTPPRRWVRAGGQWTPQALPVPSRHYDYGTAVVGDFDGDGSNDLGLAMHLVGFSALLARDPPPWRDAAAGLPSSAAGAILHGSGVGIAVLPQRGGDRLLLLRESFGKPGPARAQAPGLAEYRWDGDRWRADPVSGRTTGRGLALALIDGCAPLLAVETATNNQLPVFERRRGKWQGVPVPLADTATWYAMAVAAGDFDARACADLAIARRVHSAAGWVSKVDLLLQAGTRDQQRVSVESGRGDRQASALHAAASPGGGIDLLVGGADGSIDRYRVVGQQVEWIAHAPVPAWREGCAVSDIDHFAAADGTLRWLVAFAGDNDLLAPRRCRSGGGLVEFRWRATGAADQSPD